MTTKRKAPQRRRLKIRGLMLDPARLTERHEFYFDLLPKLARWGFNTVWWHFVDDEGFALKIDSHPEIVSPYAFTKAEMRAFITEAAELGIDVVPEVETLGHAEYITRLPQYAHLANGEAAGFNAICPSHRDTLPLLRGIIEEVAELFESPYFHAGMDEVSFAGCPRCARRAKGKPKWWIYAQHVKAIHGIVTGTGTGKRMIMWADHVEKAPALLRTLPKDIIMGHWQYREVRPDDIKRSVRAGFQVIGAPSMLHAGKVIHPHQTSFTNTEDMIATISRHPRGSALGVVNTWWTPDRILRDTTLPAIAYTGHLLNGGDTDKVACFHRYLREEYGVRSRPAAQALWDLHQYMVLRNEMQVLAPACATNIIAAVQFGQQEGLQGRTETLRGAVATLTKARKNVRCDRDRKAFDATLLAGRLAVALLENGFDFVHAYDRYRWAEWLYVCGCKPPETSGALDEATEALEGIVKRIDTFCTRVSDEWDRTRHPRDEKKRVRNVTQPCRLDIILGRLVRSRAFLQELVKELRRQIAKYRRGGRFPMGI